MSTRMQKRKKVLCTGWYIVLKSTKQNCGEEAHVYVHCVLKDNDD